MRFLTNLSWKALVAGGATVATLGAGAIVANAATTESDFGQQVKAQVGVCKVNAAKTDSHGIGRCISAWVLKHNPSNADEAKPDVSDTPEVEASESPKPEPVETPEVEASESPKPEPAETPDQEDAKDVAPATLGVRVVTTHTPEAEHHVGSARSGGHDD